MGYEIKLGIDRRDGMIEFYSIYCGEKKYQYGPIMQGITNAKKSATDEQISELEKLMDGDFTQTIDSKDASVIINSFINYVHDKISNKENITKVGKYSIDDFLKQHPMQKP